MNKTTNWASEIIEKLQKGEIVTFNPVGNSMQPLIYSGDEVTVEPITNQVLYINDIVLVTITPPYREKEKTYLHLIRNVVRGIFQTLMRARWVH